MPAVSGSTTQIATSVSTPQDLAGVPDDAFKDGDLAYVGSLWPAATFRLRRAAMPLPVDNVTIIPTFSGNGYWQVIDAGSGILTFPDVPSLQAANDSALGEGAVAYTANVRDYWQKQIMNPAPAGDGITVVPTASGDGGWYRMGLSSPTWSTERVTANTVSWYVDPINGNDENDGSSSAAGGPGAGYVGALKTLQEFSRRMRVMRVDTTYTVNILGAVTSSDMIDLNPTVSGTGSNAIVVFVGQKTVVRSGFLSAANITDPTVGARGTQASITDSLGTSFTAGEWVVFTTNAGAYSGNACHVLKDRSLEVGPGNARTGQFFNDSGSATSFPSLSTGAPPPGAGYDVVSLTPFNPNINLQGCLLVYFVYLDSSDSARAFTSNARNAIWKCCKLGNVAPLYSPTANTARTFRACLIGNTGGLAINFNSLNTMTFQTCSFWNISARFTVGHFVIDGCTSQGQSNNRGTWEFGTFDRTQPVTVRLSGINAFFNWAGTAIAVSRGAFVGVAYNASGNAADWKNWLMGGDGVDLVGEATAVSVRDGGTICFPPYLLPVGLPNMPYLPKLLGRTFDIAIDFLQGASGTTGYNGAPIPPLVGGAVVPATVEMMTGAAAGPGNGWTQWNNAFGRSIISHYTGAKIFAGYYA